jgi:hypothetical protein
MADPINRLAMFSAPMADQVNMLAPQLPPGHPSNMLMWLRDQIPQVQADDTSTMSGIYSRLGRTATAIPRAGLETMANWLRGVDDPNAVRIGPDTIAPFGMFPMGMAGTAARGATAAAARSDGAIARDLFAEQPQGIRGVHYTTADFDRFDPKQFGGAGDAFGVGVYSTPMEFVHAQRKKSASNAYSYGDRFEDGARSIPTEHHLKSPFRIDMPENVGDASKAEWGALRQNWLGPKWKHDMSPYEAADAGIFAGREEAAKVFNEALRAHGKDGVTVYDGGLMREVMAMAPGRVKSSTTGETLFSDGAKSSVPGVVVGGLDMSQEARLARAREQGFDVDTPVYRGLMTQYDPAIAAQKPQYFSDNPKVASEYSGDRFAYDGASVMPAFVRPGNEAVVDAAGGPFHRIPGLERLGMSAEPYHTTDELVQAARSAGHDSVLIRNVDDSGVPFRNGPSNVRVVFDPRNIRSPQAAFDPAKRDSTDLLAASPHASAPGLAANATQDDSPVLDILTKYGLY